MSIKNNVDSIKARISTACARAGRGDNEVEIVAVSKTVAVEKIREAVAAGIKIIGENRVNEAWEKFLQLGRIAQWHLVGHLQTNKVKPALKFLDLIESVDSFHLAKEISKRALQENRTVEVFVEVNTSGEASKFGVNPEHALDLVEQISQLGNIKLSGLMTVGAFLPNPEQVRPCFTKLRTLFESIKHQHIPNVEMRHLSMGMSNDFEVAIAEGATLVRIGRAIFGER